MNRNDSPRNINKLYDIVKEIFTSKISIDKYSQEFIESLISDEEYFYLNIINKDNKYYYKGYPNGNFLKIFCRVLEIWNSHNCFPINFYKLDGLKDLTDNVIELLNSQTSTINSIFCFIKEKNTQATNKLIVNLLEIIGMRGFMTILGIRFTPGSCDNMPRKKEDLFKSFNAVFKKNDNSENKTKITVGARALSKHSDRSNEKEFWGNCKGSEVERNNKANEIFNKLLDECVWINIHYLPHSNKILEIRNIKGYGIRWNLSGEFRGLIEPEEKREKC